MEVGKRFLSNVRAWQMAGHANVLPRHVNVHRAKLKWSHHLLIYIIQGANRAGGKLACVVNIAPAPKQKKISKCLFHVTLIPPPPTHTMLLLVKLYYLCQSI
mmetsp:Transcript_24600/g.36676  ORF Transcript_24600/g.36676 Transcript_24600/m.36676 type:complete len:102 (-) Transcript_24600:118-423(-)